MDAEKSLKQPVSSTQGAEKPMDRKKEAAHPIASSWEKIADEAVRKAVFKLVSAGCRTPELALEVAKELVQSIVEHTSSSSDGESSKGHPPRVQEVHAPPTQPGCFCSCTRR